MQSEGCSREQGIREVADVHLIDTARTEERAFRRVGQGCSSLKETPKKHKRTIVVRIAESVLSLYCMKAWRLKCPRDERPPGEVLQAEAGDKLEG